MADDIKTIVQDNYVKMRIFRDMFSEFMQNNGFHVGEIKDPYMPHMEAYKQNRLTISMIQFLDPYGPSISVTGKFSSGDVSCVFYYSIRKPFENSKERFQNLLDDVKLHLQTTTSTENKEY